MRDKKCHLAKTNHLQQTIFKANGARHESRRHSMVDATKKKKGRTLEWICSIRTLFVATCEESQQTKWNVARSVILMRSPDPVFLAARRRKCLKIAWKREKSNKYLHRTNQVNIHYWFVYRQKWPMAKELINHAENWMKLCRQTFYNS